MKHSLTRLLCVLLCALCLTCAALAAETYPNIGDLYQRWAEGEMPDWVCSVSSTDGNGWNLTVVVNSQAGADELNAMVEDKSTMEVIVTDGAYSHNQLMEVQEAITEEYMAPDGPVVSIGTGWAVIDGEVTGFGESGRESRVVVGIKPDQVEKYGKLLEEKYGDMIYIESSDPVLFTEDSASTDAVLEELPATSAPVSFIPWVCLGAVILAAAVVVVWRMRKKSSAKTKT